MQEAVVCLLSLVLSIYIWGLLRTALWIVPTLFIRDSLPLVSGSLLSFWIVAGFFAPHVQGCFDLRDFNRQKWGLIFFFAGILTGTLFYPAPSVFFALGAIIPLASLHIFALFKHPAQKILFLPKRMKWILTGFWLICFLLKFL